MKKCNAGHLRQIHIYFQVIDSQDGAASKERERQMRQEIGRLQTDLDKERIKAKSNAEKVSVWIKRVALTFGHRVLWKIVKKCRAHASSPMHTYFII